MRILAIIGAAIALVSAASAEEVQQEAVLSCLSEIGTSTEWNTCLNQMFEPCAGEEVGSEGHVACLVQQKADWRLAKVETELQVLERLTEGGVEELGGVMLAWPKFVDDKCEAVAASRAEISSSAAKLGCEISEHVLVTFEFRNCLEGRSTEDYCEMKDGN